MTLQIKRRGRPPKVQPTQTQPTQRPDYEVLESLKTRFSLLNKLTHAAAQSAIKNLTVTGAPGIGKSYTVHSVLESYPNIAHEVISGDVSAIELFKLAYRLRQPGSVLVLDDADTIFKDEAALNILKVLCDSGDRRTVSWLKQSLDNTDIPTSFNFEGACIFISNINWQQVVDMGANKYAPHMEALMSRGLYLDLMLHDTQAVSLWINHVTVSSKMFERHGLDEQVGESIMQFIRMHRDNFRVLSLRTVNHLIGLYKANPERWEVDAKLLLLRTP
jgi:hypothetical protein